MRWLWDWIVLAIDSTFHGINRGLWLLAYPFRRFTSRHHCKVADWYDTLAHRMQAEGRDAAAAELREIAKLRRLNARRLK